MKMLIVASLLLFAANPQAKAADYTSCRSELQQIGYDYADYYAQQDDKCRSVDDKLADACTDNGVSVFVAKVRAL